MKLLLFVFLIALFSASILPFVPESSRYSLTNVTAMLRKSTQSASDTLTDLLPTAQAHSLPPSRSPGAEDRRRRARN